jgi:hypothetical protein
VQVFFVGVDLDTLLKISSFEVFDDDFILRNLQCHKLPALSLTSRA